MQSSATGRSALLSTATTPSADSSSLISRAVDSTFRSAPSDPELSSGSANNADSSDVVGAVGATPWCNSAQRLTPNACKTRRNGRRIC